MKKIGILGGMGPEATSDMYMKIIKIFQKKFNAKFDKDFPEIIIYSMPIPDVVVELDNEKLLISCLTKGVKKLEKAGADFVIIACNTVQYYLPEMKKAISIPILSVVEETSKKIQNYKKVGLLGTEITLKKNVFGNLKKEIITPTKKQQKIVTKVITDILTGNRVNKGKIEKIIYNLQTKWAEGIILGCTELPLIIDQKDYPLEIFDTTQIIAEAAVKISRGK
jgi:aspartate racemase|tara:strand:- start:1787 stop:2455 length:669 start_codon:yes stop_codon:yes gene_type:complete